MSEARARGRNPERLVRGILSLRSIGMKAALVLIVGVLLNLPALGADLEPYLKSAPMPFYPVLARQARVMGKVIVALYYQRTGRSGRY